MSLKHYSADQGDELYCVECKAFIGKFSQDIRLGMVLSVDWFESKMIVGTKAACFQCGVLWFESGYIVGKIKKGNEDENKATEN